MYFDAFISHAWEDKEDFVRELAEKLQEYHIDVWYDEFSLKIGDSLRRSIDFGLSKSRYGIVVFSKSFFEKEWTNWELDGLVQRQNNVKTNLIIPIWHNIEKKDIIEYSPSLADKIAIKSEIGISNVVQKINDIINPQGSTLIIARDFLISKGFTPPPLTDDWWLDVLEYNGDTFLENDYLKFTIHWKGYEPFQRGEFVGLTALQMSWRKNSEELDISQLSHPQTVIDFINSQPGLKEMCISQPLKTALFFPQLTINGYNDFMEPHFEEILRIGSSDKNHTCIEVVALKEKNYGKYSFSTLASFYFTGDGGGLGPSTSLYDLIDCLLWLLSAKSEWLPKEIRRLLLKGLCDWGAWTWYNINYDGFEKEKSTGEFNRYLFDLRDDTNKVKTIPPSAEKDLLHRIQITIDILDLPESKETLMKIFIERQIIESWVNSKFNRKKGSR